MRPVDLILYLFGNRGSIERIAAARHAWAVGAILVLSAGVARNYDHLDLLRNPEWISGPFIASLVTVSFIFLCLLKPLKLAAAGATNTKQLGTFLVLAWFTAPCAWLYGLPVEAMTDIVTATRWNIAFLAVVALWRVAIIVRAVSVLTGVGWIRVLPLVLAPAAFETMVASAFKGLALVSIMGGVRLPPHTEVLRAAAVFTQVASFWIFIAAVIAAIVTKGSAHKPLTRPPATIPAKTFITAAICLLAWLLAAIPLHPEIANRHRLQALITDRRYDAAYEFAAARQRSDFPRIHHLPPGPDRFPQELIDALPPNPPIWLREKWNRDALTYLTWSEYALHTWDLADLHRRHPHLDRELKRHAHELRQANDLAPADRRWLRTFDYAKESSAED